MKKIVSFFLALMLACSCIVVPTAVSAATSADGILKYQVKEDGTCTILGLADESVTELVIPAQIDGYTVSEIGQSAFRECGELTSVTFGEGSELKTIGSYAFYQCDSLESIAIPDSVTSIGSYAFAGLFMTLSNLTFGQESRLESIGAYAFYKCDSLTQISIPSSVTYIGGCAFKDCYDLATIVLPETAIEIESEAFANTACLNNSWDHRTATAYIGNHLIRVSADRSGAFSVR